MNPEIARSFLGGRELTQHPPVSIFQEVRRLEVGRSSTPLMIILWGRRVELLSVM